MFGVSARGIRDFTGKPQEAFSDYHSQPYETLRRPRIREGSHVLELVDRNVVFILDFLIQQSQREGLLIFDMLSVPSEYVT